MSSAIECNLQTRDRSAHKLRLAIGSPTGSPSGRGALSAQRTAWLVTELTFLAETCALAVEDLATVALKYTSAIVATEQGHDCGTVVEVSIIDGDAAAGTECSARGRPSRTEFQLEAKPFGDVLVVHELGNLGVYLLRIRSGGTIPWHVHRVMCESEMILGTGLVLQGRPVPRGLVVRWPHGHPHRYDNPTPTPQSVLCVDMPAFIPADEIEVPAPADPSFPGNVAVHRPDGSVVRWAT